MWIGHEEDVLEWVLHETVATIGFDHAPREPIDLTGCRVVHDELVAGGVVPADRPLGGRRPGGRDHQVGGYVDGYDVGGGVAVADHCAQNALANGGEERRRPVEVVYPPRKWLVTLTKYINTIIFRSTNISKCECVQGDIWYYDEVKSL